MNSKDPKMAALSAYVKANAEFEMQYGTTAVLPIRPQRQHLAFGAGATIEQTGDGSTLAEAQAFLALEQMAEKSQRSAMREEI